MAATRFIECDGTWQQATVDLLPFRGRVQDGSTIKVHIGPVAPAFGSKAAFEVRLGEYFSRITLTEHYWVYGPVNTLMIMQDDVVG